MDNARLSRRRSGAAPANPPARRIPISTMTARILDGKRIADELLDRIAARVAERVAHGRARPGLAVVLVGADPASGVYVKNKRKACAQVGFRSFDYDLPASTPEAELSALIDRLNADPSVHGILVQLPLPPHIDSTAIINRIDPRKDVDGFNAANVGALVLRQRGLRSCTPKGVMTLLAHTDRPIRGQHAVIVGVSNHVGRPMLLELLLAGCTTTSCHKFTRDLAGFVAQADIVVVAVGRPNLVKGAWIKPGAIVVDVGINRLDDGRLVGDVEFDVAAERASWITPVPGGVGRMTVATLIENTLEAAETFFD
jgi:methylenetetrahydrofolate dehydrogenase (NADP+)/methenyltetrahydrofolate cyclohydrolase